MLLVLGGQVEAHSMRLAWRTREGESESNAGVSAVWMQVRARADCRCLRLCAGIARAGAARACVRHIMFTCGCRYLWLCLYVECAPAQGPLLLLWGATRGFPSGAVRPGKAAVRGADGVGTSGGAGQLQRPRLLAAPRTRTGSWEG